MFHEPENSRCAYGLQIERIFMKTKNAVCDAMRYATSALLFALLICKASGAGSPAGDVVGKVVVGYQGWSRAPATGRRSTPGAI